jgi:hypothetical protein
MREKKFFAQVAQRISLPSIVIVENRYKLYYKLINLKNLTSRLKFVIFSDGIVQMSWMMERKRRCDNSIWRGKNHIEDRLCIYK